MFPGKVLEFVPYKARHSQGQRLTGSVETTMSSSLPPELLDLIVDHLHDDPTALKTCSVVSKSWIPRTRRHLFAHVEFHASKSHVGLWKKAFPDPSNSPAYHTRTLSVHRIRVIAAADTGVDGWIRTFRSVVHLKLSGMDRTSPIPFCGLSPAIRSLSLINVPLDAFDLICSFPLLEDLTLVVLFPVGDEDGWNPPLKSPKLTGTLDLKMFGRANCVTRRLLVLPDGLHFSKITVLFTNEGIKSVTDLVSKCSGTLEFLTLHFWPRGAFLSTPVNGQHLTTTRTRRDV